MHGSHRRGAWQTDQRRAGKRTSPSSSRVQTPRPACDRGHPLCPCQASALRLKLRRGLSVPWPWEPCDFKPSCLFGLWTALRPAFALGQGPQRHQAMPTRLPQTPCFQPGPSRSVFCCF